jgi:hypothetical protein
MRCQAAGFSREKLIREVREDILAAGHQVSHHLWCQECGMGEDLRRLLSWVGWDELDFLEALMCRELGDDA